MSLLYVSLLEEREKTKLFEFEAVLDQSLIYKSEPKIKTQLLKFPEIRDQVNSIFQTNIKQIFKGTKHKAKIEHKGNSENSLKFEKSGNGSIEGKMDSDDIFSNSDQSLDEYLGLGKIGLTRECELLEAKRQLSHVILKLSLAD